MRILFCNITYLKYYDGRVAGEYKPKSGGRWVQENEDAHEKWNFLNMDGYCNGFVQNPSEQIHIERLDKVYSQQEEADDITVIWCASHPTRGTVVVGWYEHATVYRYIQTLFATPYTGIERDYWFRTKAEHAYLLPEEDRTLEIGRSSKTGAGTGFGQQNYWYADSKYAKEHVIPSVLAFMETHRNHRINTLPEEFLAPTVLPPLCKEEVQRMESLGADEYKEYLSFAYRMYANNPSADNAFQIAACLTNLFQYSMSIPWYEKTIALDPEDWDTTCILAYVYQQCGKYEESIALAKKLLKSATHLNADFRDEIYCVLADNYCWMGDITTAVSWLDKLLEVSKNSDLLEHTKRTKFEWMNQLQ